MAGFGGAVKLTGESEYKKALNQITQNLKEVSSQMKVVSTTYDSNDKSLAALNAKEKELNNTLNLQKEKLSTLNNQYSSMNTKYQEQINKHNQLVSSYNSEKAKLDSLSKTVGDTSKEYQEQKGKVEQLAQAVTKSSSAQESNAKAMSNMRIQINNAQADINKTTKEIDNLGKETEDTGKKAEKAGDGFTIFKGILANLGAQAITSAVNGMRQLGSSFINLGKNAIESYAEFEQLEGGIKTLFGTETSSIEEYAKTVGKSVDEVKDEYSNLVTAQNEVFKNANDAYKTAGMSANEYMDTVTSFSASLISSLDGDTVAAAKAADQAITDMSDNANKMGTNISNIQNAYQGFAKQNYTMLDNLKLGYGGTKTEMERLLSDAEKISGVKYDISSLNDVYEAIHVVQTEMGITGTTAKEASTTIQGSVSSMKAAWQNLLTGLADDNADFGQLTNNLVESIMGKDGEGGVLNNILPRIHNVIDGIGTMVTSLLKEFVPKVLPILVDSISEMTPTLIDTIKTIIQSIVDVLPTIIDAISQVIPDIISMLVELLPQLLDVGIKAILSLVEGITQALPQLMPTMMAVIMDIVNILLDNIDEIIECGIELLVALTEGLMNALPELISRLPEIIIKITNKLIELSPQLLSAALRIIMALAEGLIKYIPEMISRVPQIIKSIVNAFKDGLGDFKSIGSNLLKGLWEGMSNTLEWLKSKIKGLVGNVTSFIKKMFGIHSPSTVFRDEIGTNLALGLGEGFENTMSSVTKDMAESIPKKFNVEATANVSAQKDNASYGSYYEVVSAFKDALSEMTIELDDENMGKFIDRTVARTIYS